MSAQAPKVLGYAVVRIRGHKADLTHATLYLAREDAEHEQRAWVHSTAGGERYVVATITTP